MKLKNKILAGVVTTLTAASVTVSSLFGSPTDLVKANDDQTKVVIEAVVETADQVDADADEDDSDEDKKKGFKQILKQQIMRVPVVIRGLVGVPLWCAGWGITCAATAAWKTFLAPMVGTALGWLMTAGFILLAAVLAIKTLFPDVPLKKILIKENVWTAAAGTLLIALICAVLPVFWVEFDRYENLIRLAGGMLIMAIIVVRAKFGPDSYDHVYSY